MNKILSILTKRKEIDIMILSNLLVDLGRNLYKTGIFNH